MSVVSSANSDVNFSSSMSAVASSATNDDFMMSNSILVMSAFLPSDGFPELIDVNSSASRCAKPFADVNSLIRCLLCNRQGCDARHCGCPLLLDVLSARRRVWV